MTIKAQFFLAAIAFASAGHSAVDAFAGPSPTARVAPLHESSSAVGDKPSSTAEEELTLESYLQQNYPLFESLILSKIEGLYPALRDAESSSGYTLFCPSDAVMEGLDPQRKVQLSDPRNDEVTEKLAQYHVVASGSVTWERLKREDWTVPKIDGVAALSIGGVLTLGGELRVGRSKSGGFLGWGAKEDGGVVIGNNDAKVVKSTAVGNGVVHEVDGLVAPDLIWRYFDQLRIPGF